MAFAILGGLLVATVLTLLFTPALYALVFASSGRRPRGRAENVPQPFSAYKTVSYIVKFGE